MLIRDAVAADWPAIWPFMQPIVAAGETFSWDRDTTEADARSGWFSPPPGTTLVAVDEATGRVIGTASVHRNHGGPAAHVASASFMVHPGRVGRGAGRALGEAALARARREGFRAMQFNACTGPCSKTPHRCDRPVPDRRPARRGCYRTSWPS